MKNISLLAAALTLSLSLHAVSRADAGMPLTTTVHVGDLDLTRKDGSIELYRRIVKAAHVVCSPLDPSGTSYRLSLASRYEKCINTAIDGAVAQVTSPQFAAYVQSRSAASTPARLTLAAR